MRVRFDNDFKRYHTTTVSSPPMRQTKEQTDQTADTKEQKNQTNLMLFLGFLQPLCFCGETKWPWMNPGCAAQDWSVWFSVTWPHLGLHLWNCMWTAYNQSLRCAQTKKTFKKIAVLCTHKKAISVQSGCRRKHKYRNLVHNGGACSAKVYQRV